MYNVDYDYRSYDPLDYYPYPQEPEVAQCPICLVGNTYVLDDYVDCETCGELEIALAGELWIVAAINRELSKGEPQRFGG